MLNKYIVAGRLAVIKMSDALTLIVLQLGIGGVGGFFIGYTIRKVRASRANKTKRQHQ